MTRNQELERSIARESGLEIAVNRYDRQELITGWDQKKLLESNVCVAGSGILAQYAVMGLSALGFGTIEVYSPETAGETNNGFSGGFIPVSPGKPKVEAIAEFAAKINPTVKVYGVRLGISSPGNMRVIGNPDLIIDATNDSISKKELVDYSMQLANTNYSCRFISIASGDNISKAGSYHNSMAGTFGHKKKVRANLLFYDLNGQPQDPFTGMSMSALAVDEARKHVMPLPNDKVIEDIIIHNLSSKKRFDNSKDYQIAGQDDLSNKRVLMVGAGALGNFVGLGLAMSGIGEAVIFDGDVVEATNLNRQPFFYNSVGAQKTSALIRELKKINRSVRYKGFEEFIGLDHDSFFKEAGLDLIIDCVDNDKARALLNYFSTKYRIPMISSATRYNSGHVNVSVPGKTACLNCQREIDKYALNAQERAANTGCIYAPQASVITSNMITAGLVLGELKVVLSPEKFGEPITRELKYSSEDQYRVGVLPAGARACNCLEDKEMIKAWPKKMKDVYEKKR